jgi:VanZ family protein
MRALPLLRFRALWLAGGWLVLAAIVWLSLTPAPPRLEFQQADKLGHFAGYGALMFWFCQIYARSAARAALGAAFCALGVTLELAQGALGYRTYEEFDMFANALGVLLGWAVALASGPRVFERIERLAGA